MAFDFKRAAASQKALGVHPSLISNVPISDYTPGARNPRENAVISQREAHRHIEAYGGRETIDYVVDCVGLYADPAGTAPYYLKQPDGVRLFENQTPGTPPDHKLGPADLYRLLKSPNPFMDYAGLMSLLVIDLLMVGNAYWLKWQTNAEGKPLALYRLAPSYVKVVPGQYGPKRYEYQPPGARKPMKIDSNEIVHFKRPNPHSAYYGQGVIQGAGRSMDLELALVDTMTHYYENRADPSLIVQAERRVPRDIFQKIRAQLRARVSGPQNAGEFLLLENGLKASSLSTTAADAMFVELARTSRDRIFTKFRASPLLFGLMDENSGSNKVSDFRREFDNYTLRPFLDRLQTQITLALTTLWGVEFVIDHRYQLPPEDAIKVAGEIAKAPGIKVREVRRQFSQFGIEESTGDEDIDEFVLNMPTPEADENGMITLPDGTKVRSAAVGADRSLPGEPGRPPKGENTRGFGTAKPSQKALEDILADLEARVRVEGKATPDNSLPGEIRPPDPFARVRQSDIDAHRNQIASGLRAAVTTLERDLLDHVEGKALKTSDIVARMKRSEAWKTFQAAITAVLEDGARAASVSGVMHSGRRPEEDIDYDSIVKSVVHRPEGVRAIVKTLKDRVAAHIKDVRDRDGERHDFENEVRSVISDWSTNQAVMIADSEATEAYNEATLTVLEATGDTEVYVHEEDDAEDDDCVNARGEVWPIEKARQNRKAHPRCRRAFLSVADAAVA